MCSQILNEDEWSFMKTRINIPTVTWYTHGFCGRHCFFFYRKHLLKHEHYFCFPLESRKKRKPVLRIVRAWMRLCKPKTELSLSPRQSLPAPKTPLLSVTASSQWIISPLPSTTTRTYVCARHRPPLIPQKPGKSLGKKEKAALEGNGIEISYTLYHHIMKIISSSHEQQGRVSSTLIAGPEEES